MSDPADEYGRIHASEPHRPSAVAWDDPSLPGYRYCTTCCQTWPCETAEAALNALEEWKEEP
jgi:hypothetical protein